MEVSPERLATMSKEELLECLQLALSVQALATKNMKTANDLLEAAAVRIQELEDRCKTQEAELLVLRNKP